MAAAAHLTITGRVQGVGYRMWAEREARRLALRGWVRNRRDGSVEALAIGEPAQLDAFVQACHRGPRMARVTSVRREPAEDDGASGFEERPTV